MTTNDVGDERQPTAHANYPGRCLSILTEGAKGPTTFGEPMYPVTATYDEQTTRVGFSYMAPPPDSPVLVPTVVDTPLGRAVVRRPHNGAS